MVDCTFCDNGQIEITVTENNIAQTSKIACIHCHGTKKLPKSEFNKINTEIKWLNDNTCSCKNHSNGVYYVADNIDKNILKHHWRCKNCKKIVQIG